MTAFVLAHLSDPHLAPLPRPRLHELIGKRALGYLNWRRNRHRVHRRAVVDALIADLRAQRPDHIAVTGDLVNIALPEEIARAADWLATVGPPHDVTLVPGNHDAYVRGALPRLLRAWGDYMRDDDAAAPQALGLPFVRRRGPVTLIGVSTAVPTAPFMATGTLGEAQLAALDALLRREDATRCRVLLLHHPLATTRRRRFARLTDADALCALLARHGVELVLHGHDHRHAVIHVAGPGGRSIPVVGVPSASIAPGGHYDAAAYNLVAISREDDRWRISMTTRGLDAAGAIVTLRDIAL